LRWGNLLLFLHSRKRNQTLRGNWMGNSSSSLRDYLSSLNNLRNYHMILLLNYPHSTIDELSMIEILLVKLIHIVCSHLLCELFLFYQSLLLYANDYCRSDCGFHMLMYMKGFDRTKIDDIDEVSVMHFI
jgi:hypothetical protein